MIKANKPKENWNACIITVLVSVKSKQTIHLILTLGLAKGTLVLLTGKDWSTRSFVCSAFVYHLPAMGNLLKLWEGGRSTQPLQCRYFSPGSVTVSQFFSLKGT